MAGWLGGWLGGWLRACVRACVRACMIQRVYDLTLYQLMFKANSNKSVVFIPEP